MSYQLIKGTDVCKAYGPKVVLDRISCTISKKDRIALIGENGVGKSTIARILIGQEIQDQGTVERAAGIRIGYLPQEIKLPFDGQTVSDFLSGNRKMLVQRLHEIELMLEAQDLTEGRQKELLSQWDYCHEQLEKKGGYDVDHRYSSVLDGLGLSKINLLMSMSSLSGGQRAKVAFAALLLDSPDLLILDEPTNHLDIKALEWLEHYVDEFPGALLVISHDRMFLNRTMNRIAELSSTFHKLTLYTGNYDAFLEEKQKEQDRKLQEFEEWKEEKQQLHQMIKAQTYAKPKPAAPKDRNTMAYDARGERHLRSQSRLLRQAKERLDQLSAENLENPIPKAYKGISFHPKDLFSTVAIEGEHLSKRYGEKILLDDISFEIRKGDRIVLQGENGCGKTTLFEIVHGTTVADQGAVKIAPSATLGYLDQHLHALPAEKQVAEYLEAVFSLSITCLRSELHSSGLGDEVLLKTMIGSLSFGQKKRLMLLSLMLSKCSVLLLDEPTNHLDLLTLEKLEAALLSFPGAIFAISHDRYFTEKIATKVWRLQNGRLAVVR